MMRYWDGIFFAVLWTLGMLLWAWPPALAQTVILAVCGALAGIAFHLMMRWWAKRQTRHSP